MGEMVVPDHLRSFQGKRVLVTGHTGFKGVWLCMALREAGAQVTGYALPPEKESHFSLLKLERIVEHVEGDIRNYEHFSRVLNDFRPDFVFHLAAQALVRLSYESPKLTFDTNVAGSVNVLEAVRLTPSVKVLIYVTSDKCYDNQEWEWGYRENDRLGGHDPYSASKAAAEIVFSAYMDSLFEGRAEFGAASVRAGNVIGGGDWAIDRIVPDCIRSLRDEEPVRVRNPSAIRPWQHVLEPLSGYLLLAARLREDPKTYSGAWNFGPESRDIRTVQALAEAIIDRWGKGRLIINPPEVRLREARLLRLNCDKAYQVLGWAPHWNFERTVTETVRWYKDVLGGTPAAEMTSRQVREFFRISNA